MFILRGGIHGKNSKKPEELNLTVRFVGWLLLSFFGSMDARFVVSNGDKTAPDGGQKQKLLPDVVVDDDGLTLEWMGLKKSLIVPYWLVAEPTHLKNIGQIGSSP